MITGNRITSVEAKRDLDDMITNMRFNINFDDVKTEGDNVDVAYTFTAVYEGGNSGSPKTVGQLKITGSIAARESKQTISEVTKLWKDKKTLPIQFAEDVINLLNFECGSRGTLVAYSIGFVAPLPISRAKLQEQAVKGSGAA